ncbi:BACON domain-containing protein [Thermogemmatispora sp.]|uniref:BACON domain-containing protein n=1 Tax=Thermogemmatispora sp. TaxID=1968838 RepID=UPI001D227ECA|nr:carboxypeptidase regulatory-like domain-containing protein [Thermogemmatispora sp.]MBX5450339.1 carboxypeptidase regulatory-like domain-containing protein [Thermogemmatispora sp.]
MAATSGTGSDATAGIEEEAEPPHRQRRTDPEAQVPIQQGPVTPPPEVPPDLLLPQVSLPAGDREALSDPALEMSEAAEFISESDPGALRLPRPSRLTPLAEPDLASLDIQRQNTPRATSQPPQFQAQKAGDSSQSAQEEQTVAPASSGWAARSEPGALEDLQQRLPDLWPWIQDADEDEGDAIWLQRTDPLLSRRLPTSAEAAAIEAEDSRRAQAAALTTSPLSAQPQNRQSQEQRRSLSWLTLYPKRLRALFLAFLIIALLALLGDSFMVLLIITRHQPTPVVAGGPPRLTLTPNVVAIGQRVKLALERFSPSSQVLLSHDLQEPIPVGQQGSSLVQVNSVGSLVLTVQIDASWGPGLHLVEAEDVTTRYTASATLQVAGQGLTRPPHLVIDSASPLLMGEDYQGANTILPLTLRNSGGGIINWQGSSNQPWLLLSPSQGLFSGSQTVWVAVQRAHLKPGDYTGLLTFTSDVGGQQTIQVKMVVRPLPANPGPLLQVVPAALSFIATDGGATPAPQTLTISNPGNKPLVWQLSSSTSLTAPDQTPYARALGPLADWLSVGQRSGTVIPGSAQSLTVAVQSQSLLPGVYIALLSFASPQGVLDSPQSVVVSLTILPRCGIMVNASSLSFTTVAGRSNPPNQAITLSERAGCLDDLGWQASSDAPWVSVTPSNGELHGAGSVVIAIGVNALGLGPGRYKSLITFTAGHSSQTLPVLLVVQPVPSPQEPVMSVTPLSLNFSAIQGRNTPPQTVVITNTGGSTLYWQTQATPLTGEWLSVSPARGSIPPGSSGQILIAVNTSGLTAGTYSGQILLAGQGSDGKGAAGAPQMLQVTLQVLPPCTLGQPSMHSVAFSTIAGGGDPAPQAVTLEVSGTCSWPLSWSTSLITPASWLRLSDSSTSLVNGQTASITLAVNSAGLAVGSYSTQVLVRVLDSTGAPIAGSPQHFSVTLTVLPPCVFQVGTSSLFFTAVQGQGTSLSQAIPFSSNGTCRYPITVSATADPGNAWLAVSSGSDNGSGGSLQVSVNPAGLAPGVYNGQITITASSSGGIQNNTQIVPVRLTITGYTITGSVQACADSTCSSAAPLAGASVTLYAGTTQIASTTCDNMGNYSFNNVPLGSYMLTASGSDSQGKQYSGSAAVTVTGNQTVIINALPNS